MKPMSLKALKKDNQRKRKTGPKRRPINVLPSCLTVMSLYCGMASVFGAISGNYEKAAWWILGAIIFDSLDGSVAKLTKSTSEFGKQLDSLADIVSFGVAPAVLIFTTFLMENSPMAASPENLDHRLPAQFLAVLAKSTPENPLVTRVGSLMAGFFVICGALRLARYNTFQSEVRDYFTGLPIPAAGGLIATFVLFAHYYELTVTIWLLGPLTVALAALMVSTIKYPKDSIKNIALTPRHAFRFLLFLGVTIATLGAVSDHSLAAALFPIGGCYVLLGLGNAVYERLAKPKGGSQPVVTPSDAPQPPELSSKKTADLR
jgi:CDP-diacylglycerol--serine O-phosphatidyltransferase